ncbi:hypothetical protein EJB05_05808, partial [Eragrostis curvula]
MEQQRQEDLADDLVADILRRVALRDLATSRCVCKAWRVLIDDRRLLRADLRPCWLAGLFINYIAPEINFAELFFRPSTSTELLTNSYPPHMVVADHCNGLLLLGHSVLNPATGRRVPLPARPRPPHRWMEKFPQDMFLVCDPTVSSHYEVFMIPRVPLKVEFGDEFDADGFPTFNFRGTRIDAAQLASEWLSSPCTLNVFSSVTGRWEKRSFHRDDGGEAAGTVADMQLDQRWYLVHRRHAVYYQGALYVHCENDFRPACPTSFYLYIVGLLSLANNSYQVIKPPTRLCEDPEFHLGKSEKGVYFALLDDEYRLRVWTLAESCGKMEWDLNHDSVRGLLLPSQTVSNMSLDHGF